MSVFNDPEFRKLYEEVAGLKNAVYGGFNDIKRDMGTFRQLYLPLIVWLAVATVMSVLALSVALDNRAIIKRQLVQLQQGISTIQREDKPAYTPPTR